MFHRPSTVPFSSMLIIIITLSYLTPMGGGGKGCFTETPGAQNACYERSGEFPTLCIKKNGEIMFSELTVNRLSALPNVILDEMERTQIGENKILIKIDRDVPFGKVQEVLRYVKQAGVETVGLVTEEHASLGHFWGFIYRIDEEP
jgi:biopolymer transport protein ExbD